MIEEFKILKDYPLYKVSNTGKVISLNYRQKNIEQELNPCIQKNGYKYVNLCKNGKNKLFTVHKLVAIAFLNHTPDGYKNVINHIDNNKLNNNVDNLEIVSQRYNTQAHKTSPNIKQRFNKFRVVLKIKGENIHLGNFKSIEEAKYYYNKAIKNIDYYNGDKKEFRKIIGIRNTPKIVSVNQRYYPKISINRVGIQLGIYSNIEDAIKIYFIAKDNSHLFNGDKNNFKKIIKNLSEN